jgi:ElaB/YqjD/DUF883 family membrane-anchored ribosome-binding protein
MDTSSAKASLSQHDAALRDDLDSVKEDLKRLRDDMRVIGRDMAGAARAGVREARHAVAGAADTAAERGREAVKDVERKIESNPLMSVGVAFGIGLLMGSMFSGGRR